MVLKVFADLSRFDGGTGPRLWQKLELKFDSLAAKAREKTAIDRSRDAHASAEKRRPDVQSDRSDRAQIAIRHAQEYAQADLEPLRKQEASGSGWSRIVHVKNEEESQEIYMASDGGRPAALVIIADEPEELKEVDIQGAAPPARFEELVQSTIRFALQSLTGSGASRVAR
jgi:hypothetical protein